ncbi:sugar ABC transporter permease [Pullulanibacillus sp. KACC 23026]|uniref:carbohydrate ABC transporter permease n=1 Tax=Pullulanibacillus sp. KACC 23026 TaxID=3028315 RepID=UPI0023B0324A|nr:sugar ABC transporter permease [Pullulanibacillus sp. KACC 23026]WEG11203.1 sugar ABC transporter permease [Pullulanibacillus sp. KACC 23026]
MSSQLVNSSKSKQTRSTTKAQQRKSLWAYLFITPQFILFVGLTILPIVLSYTYSFYNWNGIGPLNQFIKLDNYTRLFHDVQFWHDFVHSIIYMAGQTLIVMPLALLMAILFNESKIKGKIIYRTIYFLPVVTSTAIIGIVMANIFGNKDALINNVLEALHIVKQPIDWLDNPNLAMGVMILVGSWKFFGIVMIYWLAGLQSISTDIYEAAKIDGANFFSTLWRITLPILKPISAVILLLTVVNGLHVFDLVKTLTNGGPYHATETIDLYIYQYAFAMNGIPQMGYASAAGILFGIFVFLLSISIGWFIRRANKTEIKKGTL